MITAALEFIHARKWLVELILAAVVALAVWWGCSHLIQVGVLKERAAWLAKVTEANLETARQRGLAEAAERARQKEQNDLAQYVALNPLHGSLASLCKPPRMPAAAQANTGNDGAATGAADVLQVPEGNNRSESEPDQLGLLSILAERGDKLSSQVRAWQARQ